MSGRIAEESTVYFDLPRILKKALISIALAYRREDENSTPRQVNHSGSSFT
jgi:hypothetical protein